VNCYPNYSAPDAESASKVLTIIALVFTYTHASRRTAGWSDVCQSWHYVSTLWCRDKKLRSF